eukprot:Hpha_TRINITY_DN15972_c0_g1::TRINITY_DN15972_c0_g1_i11::g.74340::m.74340
MTPHGMMYAPNAKFTVVQASLVPQTPQPAPPMGQLSINTACVPSALAPMMYQTLPQLQTVVPGNMTQPMLLPCVPLAAPASVAVSIVPPTATGASAVASPKAAVAHTVAFSAGPCVNAAATAVTAPLPVTPLPSPQSEDATSETRTRRRRSDSEKLSEVLRVLSATPVVGLAGSITKRLRERGHASVYCVGHRGVSQAAKGLALSSNFLVSEGRTICVRPAARPSECDADLDVVVVPSQGKMPVPPDVPRIFVRMQTEVDEVVEQITSFAQTRTNVLVVSVGAPPVSTCVLAARKARDILQAAGMDLYFRPRWLKVSEGGLEGRSAVLLDMHFIPLDFAPPDLLED